MEMKPKRILKKIHFDFNQCHLAYTSKDAPACSLLDEPVMFKSLPKNGLSDIQKKLMEKLGKKISKAKIESLENFPSASEEVSEVQTQTIIKDKGNTLSMSNTPTEKEVALEKQLTSMKKQLLKSEMKPLCLPEDILTKAVDALVSLEDTDSVISAFNVLKDAKEEAIRKSLETKEEVNPLHKALEEEKGVVIPEPQVKDEAELRKSTMKEYISQLQASN